MSDEKAAALDLLREILGLRRECDWCEGTGHDPSPRASRDDACPQCGGTGEFAYVTAELASIRELLGVPK